MPSVDCERPRSVARDVVVAESRNPETERAKVDRMSRKMCWTVDLDRWWGLEGGSSALDSVGSVGVTGTPTSAF